jgi:putative ABC transport system permease protein
MNINHSKQAAKHNTYLQMILTLIDRLGFTLERLWQHRSLAFWALVGLATATTLALGLWLYVDAVNTNILTSRLSDPPYAFRFRYLGAWNGNITQADFDTATAAIQAGFTQTIGLPTDRQIRYVRGGTWTMRTKDRQNLGAFGLGVLEGADDQIQIVAGEWSPDRESLGDVIPALIPEKMLYEMGLQVGDEVTATLAGVDPVTIRVVALWEPLNPEDPAWIFPPKFFDEVFLVQPDDLWTAVGDKDKPIDESAWYTIFDGREIKTSDIASLLGRIASGERDINIALPGIRVDASPVENLNAFIQEVNQLTQQLVIMILPVAGLVLYFVTLVAGLLVSRQQPEDLMLRSRGMGRAGILGLHVMMWTLLVLLALAVAMLASPVIVTLVGQTSSFLRFENIDETLTPVFTPQAIGAAAATGLLAASTAIWMAWRTSAQTITGFKRASARASKAWWQRAYLDIIFLIPAFYVLYTLWSQGGLVASAETPFSDPLTFIGPTLFSLGLTLLFLRMWPTLLRIGGGLLNYGRSIAPLMAARELARSIGRYRGMLLMMCFTLSLIGFTASMASTLDRSLQDTINYRIGADAVLVTAQDVLAEEDTANEGNYTVTGFNAPPIEDLLNIEGIAAVSPVGRYPARLALGSRRHDGTVLGVDRATIAAVTRLRSDYASEQMAELFNRLAGNRSGIIISARTAEENRLLIGQEVALQINALSAWYELTVPIMGVVQYFPTLDPDAGFFAIMNIEPIFEAVGTPLPYDVWVSLKSGADQEAVAQAVREVGFPVIRWLDPEAEYREAQTSPSRRGVLGFLSIGFVAAVVLTLVGAIIQSAASFRAQSIQMGTLRAMGLRGLSVSLYLILTQGVAVTSGVVSGTAIGMGTTLLFLPLLDFSGGLPPYLVRVAWNDILLVYAVFASILLLLTLGTTIMMGRERLSTVVKLGDA